MDIYTHRHTHTQGFPHGLDSKESVCNAQETWVWFLGGEDLLEKGMTTHSSILAWRISWTEEPGGLQSRGVQRVRHSWATNTYIHTRACLVAQLVKNPTAMQRPRFDSWVGKIPWRRKWIPTPVFLPGESHGQRSLVGSQSMELQELDTTKPPHHHTHTHTLEVFLLQYGYGPITENIFTSPKSHLSSQLPSSLLVSYY